MLTADLVRARRRGDELHLVGLDAPGRARALTIAEAILGDYGLFGGGASFNDLWTGDPDNLQQAYPPQSPGQAWDASSADLALANYLAFWTGGNAERMEDLTQPWTNLAVQPPLAAFRDEDQVVLTIPLGVG